MMGKGNKAQTGHKSGLANQLVKEVAARIRQSVESVEGADASEITEQLRQNFPAYNRRPVLQFKKVVEEALQLVNRSTHSSDTVPLQKQPVPLVRSFVDNQKGDIPNQGAGNVPERSNQEANNVARSAPDVAMDGADVDVAMQDCTIEPERGLNLNKTLTSLYQQKPPASTNGQLSRPPPQQQGAAVSYPNGNGLDLRQLAESKGAQATPAGWTYVPSPSDSKPAFAAPHLVAAACVKALAADKAKFGKLLPLVQGQINEDGSIPPDVLNQQADAFAQLHAMDYNPNPPGGLLHARTLLSSGLQPPPLLNTDAGLQQPLASYTRDGLAGLVPPPPSMYVGPPQEPEESGDADMADAALAKRAAKKLKRVVPTDSRNGASKRLRPSLQPIASSITQPAPVQFSDLGGIDAVLKDIQELVQWPLTHPEIYAWLGVEPPRGVLLHGPPGCGKTALANAIANECGVPFLRISAPEIVSGMSGESEMKVRQLFQEAVQNAPCIIFIDEIDAIAGKRESAQREMERRIVAQMLTCMDDLSSAFLNPVGPGASASRRHVLVIGATNRPDSLDTALRRAGRFDREISLGIPNQAARARILRVIVQKLRLSGDFDLDKIASKTPGFVGADLHALTKEAAALAVSRIFRTISSEQVVENSLGMRREPLSEAEMSGLAITMPDFEAAIPCVQPSVRREGFATTPDVTWEDVGALHEVREELNFAITQPIKHPEQFQAMGLNAPSGVLLYGPPGCGKTLLAKAVANESGANFISIKGPELLNKFVGESERAVRQVFARAKAASPCVLFFDEMDALAPRRGSESNQSSERVVNQLLTEMDGVDGRQEVYIIAATNRPDIIDKALLRPGRLDKMLFIALPSAEERAQILATLARGKPLAPGVDVGAIARQCEGFSGADLGALVKEAATLALRANMQKTAAGSMAEASPKIELQHFQDAKAKITPSVGPKDQKVYDAMRKDLRSSRSHIEKA